MKANTMLKPSILRICSKRLFISLVVILATQFPGTSQGASFPVDLMLSTDTSGPTRSQIALDILGGVLTVPMTFSEGFLETEIDQTGTGPPATAVSVTGGTLEANDVSAPTILGLITMTNIGIDAGAAGPFSNVTGTNPGSLDVGGWTLNVNQGFLDLGLDSTVDLSTDPLLLTLEAGTLATISETAIDSQHYLVGLTVPVEIGALIDPNGIGVPVYFSGQLYFSGIKTVPEPSSWALFALGPLGFALSLLRRSVSVKVAHWPAVAAPSSPVC